MKLLILGGTVFLGRHLVDAARECGHQVTIFNRGHHDDVVPPDVETLRGNRDGDLTALHGRRWDAAIDTSGYLPRVVRASAELLSGAVDHYTFISTISVYADVSASGFDESTPVGTLQDETVEEVTGDTYGPLKALCEQEVEQALPGRTLTIRPGLIVGPYDPTDRFTYWPHRIAQGGEILAPQPPDRPIQVIDVRDLAAWIVRLVESRQTGVYNAVGPDAVLTMRHLLEECRRVSGADAQVVWVDEDFLIAQGVGPWVELPLWIPAQGNAAGMSAISCRKAIAAGLTFRPLADTIRDTLAWDATRPLSVERQAGLKPEREADLLREWHARGYL